VRRPRFRLRLRTLMVLVASSAILMGSAGLRSRSGYCRQRAAHYTELAETVGLMIDAISSPVEEQTMAGIDLTGLRDEQKLYARRRDRFQRVAERPWLRVPSDEPPP